MEDPAKTDTLPTRISLLERLRNPADQSSWTDFWKRYEGRVKGIARSQGLPHHDAEDVAQEVFKRVAKTIGDYKPSDRPGSFRSWLYRLTRWRATDQLRARDPALFHNGCRSCDSDLTQSERTPTIEHVPAPNETDRIFEKEFQRHLIDSLLKRVEQTISPKQLQIFQMLVLDDIPAAQVARLYGITVGAVHVIKHRTMAKLREQISQLNQSRHWEINP